MGKAASSRAPRSWAVGWALLRHSAKCPVNSRASAPKEATWRAPVQERPRTHHARHARPRGPAAGSDGAYISARARASRDRAAAARSLGRATGRTRQARAKHAQHATTWRPATRCILRSSEMGPAVSCVCSVRYSYPNDTVLGEIILVSFIDGGRKKRCGEKIQNPPDTHGSWSGYGQEHYLLS